MSLTNKDNNVAQNELNQINNSNNGQIPNNNSNLNQQNKDKTKTDEEKEKIKQN